MDLSEFLYNHGINTTTNFDLKDIAKELNIKVKVLMKDELVNNKKPITNAVINFQNSNQKGTHWVALFNSDKIYYFDSYCIPPIKVVEEYSNENEKYLMYNTLQIQPNGSKMCGQLCLYFLYLINKEEYNFTDSILTMYEEMQELLTK